MKVGGSRCFCVVLEEEEVEEAEEEKEEEGSFPDCCDAIICKAWTGLES
jgi:hypothetical protein